MRKYFIGKSSMYGNITAVSEDSLSELNKDEFFILINETLEKYEMSEFKNHILIKNLKRGISINGDYFLIKDI